jgi:hypothetical protein
MAQRILFLIYFVFSFSFDKIDMELIWTILRPTIHKTYRRYSKVIETWTLTRQPSIPASIMKCIFLALLLCSIAIGRCLGLNLSQNASSLSLPKPRLIMPISVFCEQGSSTTIDGIRFDVDITPKNDEAPNLNQKIVASIACNYCTLYLHTMLFDSSTRPMVDSVGNKIEPLYFEDGNMFGGRNLRVHGSLSTIQFAFSAVTYESLGTLDTDTLMVNITRVWNAVVGDVSRVVYESSYVLGTVPVQISLPKDSPLLILKSTSISGPMNTDLNLNANMALDSRDQYDLYSLSVSSVHGVISASGIKCPLHKGSSCAAAGLSSTAVRSSITSLQYSSDSPNADIIYITVTSETRHLHASVNLTVSVFESMKPPSFVFPVSQDWSIDQNSELMLGDVRIAVDVARENLPATLSVSCQNCKALKLVQKQILTNTATERNSTSMQVFAPVYWLNRVLRGLIYVPQQDWVGTDLIALSVEFSFLPSTEALVSTTVNITVNAIVKPPDIVLTTKYFWGLENQPVILQNISFQDPNDFSGSTYLRVIFSTDNGQLTFTDTFIHQVKVVELGGQKNAIIGEFRFINKMFSSGDCVFVPLKNMNIDNNEFGLVTMTVDKYDPVKRVSLSDSQQVVLTVLLTAVNAQLRLTVPSLTVDIIEDGILLFTNGSANEESIVRISDEDDHGKYFVNISTSVGTLSSTTRVNRKSIFFQCRSSVDCNKLIGQISYLPMLNYNGPDVIVVVARDGDLPPITESFIVSISAVNDAPVITFSSRSVTMKEDSSTPLMISPPVVISDIDFTTNFIASAVLTLTVSVDHGRFALSGDEVVWSESKTEGRGIYASHQTIFGRIHGINRALVIT